MSFFGLVPVLTLSLFFLVLTAIWFIFIPRLIIRAVVIQLSQELLIRDERLENAKNAIKRALISKETSLDKENLDEEMGFLDEEVPDED